jgi:L-lactate dehydrogenase complex protein LldF
MLPKTRQFSQNAVDALRNPQVQKALMGVNDGFDRGRQRAIDEITPRRWEELREHGREIKRHAIENLDYYLDVLTSNVEQNGGVVHFALDAKEANEIVLDIAQRNNVRIVTKSKSMVSEELALNDALERESIEVVETDLGEYIIQLSHETPFHIVAPAIHKTKEEVSALFEEKLGTEPETDVDALTGIARGKMREKFMQADMGISGVNFAVAETGTVSVVSNEGNGRMCTSLPRIHLALMGIEKVIPTLEDLGALYRLLRRAATGQRTTSYFTLVSGPRRHDDEDGPDQFHLVVIDNGRSRLLADPNLRESLYCIRCGACLNVCPVYRKVGGHSYGWVYPGPIGAVITPVMVGLDQARDLPFASTLCGACRDVCPLKIEIPNMLLTLRSQMNASPDRQRRARSIERLVFILWSRIVSTDWALAQVRNISAFLQKPFVSKGRMRRLPLPVFTKWTKNRDFPALAKRSFHDLWRDRLKNQD